MTVFSEALLQQARDIRLLATDIDGVLTNGELIYTDDGRELKIFNVKDGHGIAMLRACGMEVAWITGRESTVNERRAQELKVKYLFQGIRNKLPVLEGITEELGIALHQVLYVGDDTPDIPVLEAVGLAACPADAVDEVKRICHYTTEAPGGRGAVREITDLLMQSQALTIGPQATRSTPRLAEPNV